jgi:type IV pilus assembly protein PilB
MSEQLQAILARTGTLTDQELEVSLRLATARKMSLWDSLVLERQVPEEALAEAFSRELKLPRVRLDAVEIQASAVRAVAAGLARKHTCLPLRLARNKIVLAMSNPLDEDAIQDVQFASSRQVERRDQAAGERHPHRAGPA